MKPSEEVIERIRKCLALANGRNATPAEMETAMAKAKEIAMRHSIELASVKLDEGKGSNSSIEIENDTTLGIRSKYEQPYHRWIFHILRKVFSVGVVPYVHWEYNGKRISAIHLIGEATDIAISKEIFKWLEEIFPRTLSKAVRSGVMTVAMADVNGCYQGLYYGIVEANERIEEQLSPTESKTWALVVRNKDALVQAKMQEIPLLRQSRQRNFNASEKAFDYGREEGKKINLRQVNSSTTRVRIGK